MLRIISFLALFRAGLAAYYVVAPAGNFSTTEAYCQSMGLHLVSIHNVLDNTAVQVFAESKYIPNFWIGMSGTSGKYFSWTDGSALDYFNWAPGFPTYDPCVAQPKCDFGWTQLAETSQCYLPGQAATHDDALAACRKMYARLTSIHTKSENDFIMALAPPSPVQQQCNPEAPYGIWTGGMAMNGYDSWADGTAFSYPNLYGNGDPSSGAIYLAAEPGCPDFGKWRVTPSKTLTLSYVCKKNPM
ncbi:unnamed protein product, partial [Mesorhabditis spiculigera]